MLVFIVVIGLITFVYNLISCGFIYFLKSSTMLVFWDGVFNLKLISGNFLIIVDLIISFIFMDNIYSLRNILIMFGVK